MVPVVPGTQHVTRRRRDRERHPRQEPRHGGKLRQPRPRARAADRLRRGGRARARGRAVRGDPRRDGTDRRDRVGSDRAAAGDERAAVGRHRPGDGARRRARAAVRPGRAAPRRVARPARAAAGARDRHARRASRRPGAMPTAPPSAARATVPAAWPGGLLRPSAVRAFNELRYRRAPRVERGAARAARARTCSRSTRSTRGRGCTARRASSSTSWSSRTGQERVARAGDRAAAALAGAVLPGGAQGLRPAGGAPLSFPIAGWTLALDLPRAAPGLTTLLDGFDELVAERRRARVPEQGRTHASRDVRGDVSAARASGARSATRRPRGPVALGPRRSGRAGAPR